MSRIQCYVGGDVDDEQDDDDEDDGPTNVSLECNWQLTMVFDVSITHILWGRKTTNFYGMYGYKQTSGRKVSTRKKTHLPF